METILSYAGSALGLLFFVCYGYQLVYMFITAFMNVPKPKMSPKITAMQFSSALEMKRPFSPN